jgi:hypothetical protein
MANHVVNSLKFEINVATKSSFDELSDEIPELVKTSIAELIDQILSELYPSHHLLVIDKLEIDLGSLRLSHLQSDLTQKFKNEFRVAIKKQLQSSSPQVTSAGELPFIILDDYIRRGIRPSWLSSREASFGEHVANALVKNPKKFSKQIGGYLKNPTQKKRVLENLSEEILVQSVLVEHPLKSVIPADEITRLKDFFRQQYRHLDANSASMLFKSMLADILIHPQKINTLTGFRAAVGEAIVLRFGAEVASSYQQKAVLSAPLLPLEQTPSVGAGKPLLSNLLEVEEGLIQKFQFFMVHGYSLVDNRPTAYRFRNINTLFETLLAQNFDELVEFLLKYGKSALIKRRFLDSLSQDTISTFFGKVAPNKRKLLEWVVEVFEQVQEEYQPINQTQIQVKKSINEITFDLFLTKNLQSISDENYLRLLFKKTAQKYGVSYKNLLFMTLKSMRTGQKKQSIFNFNQTLLGIYGKDILKRNEFRAGDWILFTKEDTEQEWRTNYQNKEDVISLFSGLYREQVGTIPSEISTWLRTRLQGVALDKTSPMLELWEEFARLHSLPVGDLLLPLLLENKANRSLKLNAAEVTFWLKKYGIQGVYATKPVDSIQLLDYLQAQNKMISAGTTKKIAAGLQFPTGKSKVAFSKLAVLLRPRLAPSIPGLLTWIQQYLQTNKVVPIESRLFTWLYHQLLLLPSSQLTIPSLQEKIKHFLQLNEGESSLPASMGLPKVSKMAASQKMKQGSVSSKIVARLFNILGHQEVYGIFSEAKRYEEEILFKLLITKYAKPFYELVATHRFNPEFQDSILVQAPKWLKKQILDFLLTRSSFDWNTSISVLTSYFEANKWVALEGVALEAFLERILWNGIFDGGGFSKEELVLELLGNALDGQLISDKFWKDLQLYHQHKGQPKETKSTKAYLNFAGLEKADGFAYFIARSGYKNESPTILPILESLVYDAIFPVGHIFEGNSSEEFSDYISRLVVTNKTDFLDFFAKIKHPYLSRKFFNILKTKGLVEVIKEKHKRDRVAISIGQLEKILKIFNLQDPVKTDYFLRAWLVFLFHSPIQQRSAASLAVEVGELLEEEGLLEKGKLNLEVSYSLLSKLFGWTEAEKNHFFKQAGAWTTVEIAPIPILELTNEEQIYAYFSELKDPFLRDLRGKGFLQVWLNLFFDSASTSSLNAFVEIFKNSFYENSHPVSRKKALFFKRFLQLKESYSTFQEAVTTNSQVWLEFRQNNPAFFVQYEQEAAPKPIQMSLLELLNFYLSSGVLPKEEGSLQAFVKKLMALKGADLIQLRGLFLAGLLDSKKKKLIYNLLRYVDEDWFYGLLHPKLSTSLDKLVTEVRRRTGSNFFEDLRIQHAVDRILFFTESLSKTRSTTKHLVELLLPVFEQWVDTKSSAVVARLFEKIDQKSEILVMIQHSSKKVKKALEEEVQKIEVEQPKIEEPEEVNLAEGVTIYNAGMVLCWPFFGRFFAALGLVEQGNFKGQQAEERGVQLLQYLATGLTSFEEWDLSLNKVLCGVSMNTPISPNLELTVEEEELVRKLINGTIFNWEKMRGTRLETFRETFFMREGILYEKDNRWELVVERKAYDVLMDTMTWNISMINLSWMKKRLNVQWK